MATATKQTTPPPPPADVVTGVTLVLSLAEARTLAVMYARVSGDSHRSPRRHANAVCAALDGVGITYYSTPEHAALEKCATRYLGFNFNDYGGE